MGGMFYPVGSLYSCHQRICAQTTDLITSGSRIVNIVGQQSVGKSQAMARVARTLDESRLVAWWNCYAPFDDVALIRMAVAQTARENVINRVHDRFGRGLSKLEIMSDSALEKALIWFLDTLDPVLFLDDFDNILGEQRVLKVLSAVADNAQAGCVVVISRAGIQGRLGTSEIIPVLGIEASDWRMTEEAAQSEMNVPDNLKNCLGDGPYLPRDIAQLQEAIELGRETNQELPVESLRMNPPAALMAFFYDHIKRSATDRRVLRWLLDLSILRGPRPLKILWSLQGHHGLLLATAQHTLAMLAEAQVVLVDTAGRGRAEPHVHGRFHVTSAFASLLQGRLAEDLRQAHEHVALTYDHQGQQLQAAFHANGDTGLFASALPEIGEAIFHYSQAGMTDNAWSLLKRLQKDMEALGEMRLVHMWMAQLVSKVTSVDLRNPYLDLCRLSRKMTNPPALRQYLKEAIRLRKAEDTEDTAEIRLYQSTQSLYEGDLRKAWRFLNTALEERSTVAPDIRNKILLQRCRLATLRGCPADFQAALQATLPVVAKSCDANFLNFLYSCVAEYYALMGLASRAVAWADKAAEYGAHSPFRKAISAYWSARCRVGLVELLQRQKGRLEQELASHQTEAMSPRLKHLDDQINRHASDAMGQALQAADEFDDAGSCDVWWGMEIQKCLAYAYKINRQWHDATRALDEAYHLDTDQQCERNHLHLDLLKARLLIAQMEDQGFEQVDSLRRDAVAALDKIAERLKKPNMVFPFELAQLREMQALLGGNGLKDFIRAMMIYQDCGLIYHVGRCCEFILRGPLRADAVRAEPVVPLLAWVLAPDTFIEPDYTVSEKTLEAIQSVLAGPIPQRWGDLLLSHPARFLITSLLPVAVEASVEELKSMETRRRNPHPHTAEELAHVARTETEFLRKIRHICGGVADRLRSTPEDYGCLRRHDRLPCKKWKCLLLADDKMFQAQTCDISQKGMLLSVAVNGDAHVFDAPGIAVTVRMISGPERLRKNIMEFHGKTIKHAHDVKPHFKLPAESGIPYDTGLPIELDGNSNLEDALREFGCFTHDGCYSGICANVL